MWAYFLLRGKSGPEVIKRFSFSTQLSMIFQMLISIKNIKKFSFFSSSDKFRMLFFLANNCWHFNIYEREKIHAQLSFITLGPGLSCLQRNQLNKMFSHTFIKLSSTHVVKCAGMFCQKPACQKIQHYLCLKTGFFNSMVRVCPLYNQN